MHPQCPLSTRFVFFELNRKPRWLHWPIRQQTSADLGGGGDRTPPPLRFVRGGVLCIGLMGRRGGPMVVLTLLLSFFSARFTCQYYGIQTYYLYIYTYAKLNSSMRQSFCLNIFPLSKLWQEWNFQSLALGRCHIFLVLNCTILHHLHDLSWKFSRGGPQNTFTISNLPCQLCIYAERDFQYPTPENKLVHFVVCK